MNSAYEPMEPARRPGGKPEEKPCYRVLVHRKYESAWEQIVERVGIQQAQQFWDHVAKTPGMKDPIASTRPLKGKAGAPRRKGFRRPYIMNCPVWRESIISIAILIEQRPMAMLIRLCSYWLSIIPPTDVE